MARRADRAVELAWRERVEGQRRSGLSIAAFCRRERISQPSFYSWRKRLAGSAAERPLFVPVQVADDAPASAGLEIELPGGAVVRLPSGASQELIRLAIAAAARAGREEETC